MHDIYFASGVDSQINIGIFRHMDAVIGSKRE